VATDLSPDRRELLKNALGAIEQLKARVRSLESAGSEPIAIVGASCRFPGGANSLDEYWALLDAGRNVVTQISADRWERVGHPGAPLGWPAGLVDDIDGFDPRFFGISAREATTMDPQQRMVLEVAWEALENAGVAPDGLGGSRTGVFLGITGHDYADLLHDVGGVTDVYAATGNANNAAAGRLSFLLGLQGPSMAVDTACSSSLVAVHLACLALRAGDCRLAIAGGVNALLAPDPFICFRNWGMMSPDGRCKTFDAAADGFVRGEGCGMIVVKRLSDAQADGDRILAVIRGSSVNQDGRSSGLTVPNGPAQEAVIRQALAVAKVEPTDVSYVEAHGTGTALGDPIEASALAAVLGAGRATDNPLVLGSVKTNIGHLESAAGVAGLLKVVLSLQHERIPAHLNFTEMNPDIDWGDVPVDVPVSGRDWRRGDRRRIAGVSSFGFSGTNAHVVLEEAPSLEAAARENDRARLFTLSAKTDAALDDLAQRFVRHLDTSADSIADICHTANTGRAQFAERVAIQARSRGELRDALVAKRWIRGRASPAGQRVAFLFTGQGSQWRGMGRDLYEHEPVFRAAMDECARLLEGRLEYSLIDVIYGDDAERASLLDDTAYTQPALFALEWSLAQLWKHWGIEPSVVLGHSVGEYVALTVAGVWSVEDGIRIIAERGRMMQALGRGWGMTAAHCSRSDAESVLDGAGASVSIAAVNGPADLVLAGRLEDLATIEARLEAVGVQAKRLTVSHAFHSAQMDDVAGAFARAVEAVPMNEPRVRVVSSVTGKFVAGAAELADPVYWRRQVRHAVEFAAAMDTLAAAGFDTFVEVGPTSTLCSLGRECIGRDGQLWAPSMRRDQTSSMMLDSLARLYVRGAAVRWSALDAGPNRRRVALPTYPFQRQRHWVSDAPRARRRADPSDGDHPLLGARFEIAGPTQTFGWQTDVSFDAFPYLADHRVQGGAIVPATAYLEMAVAAGHAVLGPRPMRATDAQFLKPLFLTPSSVAHVQVTFEVESNTARIHSRLGSAGGWTLHAQFRVVEADVAEPEPMPADFASRSARQMTGAEFYDFFAARGNQWGPAFQGVEHAWLGDQEGWARVAAPPAIAPELGNYYFHPAVADAAGHVLAAIAAPERGAFVGQGIDSVCIYDRPRGTRLLARARLTPTENSTLRRGDVTVFDEDGRVVARLFGAQLRYLDVGEEPGIVTDVGDWMYQVAWRDAPFVEGTPDKRDWAIVSGAGTMELAARLAEHMRADGVAATIGTDPSPDWMRATLSQRAEPVGIVDLRGLELGHPESASRDVARGVASLLELVRVAAGSSDARLWIATRGAQPVDAAPSSEAIWQAPLWGIGRTLAVEHPEIHGGIVDLDSAAPTDDSAAALWRHLRAPGAEDQVALRGAQRFAARLEDAPVPERPAPRMRSDAAYLVTGGLGGLGLEIARWLVTRGARHLLLVGRTPLPERSTWDDLDANHPRASVVQAIRDLERAGAVVRTGAVDVGDADALARWLAAAREAGPPVAGVVHAAGVLRHELMADLTEDAVRDVLSPKLGAWSVSRALTDAPLDFFVCFSSASALLGSPKLGAYAAANCFLDALAHHLRGQGVAATSIDWGVWGEAGMASRFDADAVQSLAERGMGAMRTEQGLDALARIIGDASSQRAVLPVDWQRWAELFPAYTASPMLSTVLAASGGRAGSAATSSDADAIFQAPASERPARVRDYLARALGRILGFAAEEIDASLPISVLGLDSLMAVELKNRIASDLRVTIPTVRLLQGPSLAELAADLEPRLEAGHGSPRSHAELLERVDELSDAEVDAALAALLNGREVA
jgi:acyl transferase domain-containing protein